MPATLYTATSTPTAIAISGKSIITVQNLGLLPARLSLNEATTPAGSINLPVSSDGYQVPVPADITQIAISCPNGTTQVGVTTN